MKSLILYTIILTFFLFSCKKSSSYLYTSLTKTNRIKLICFNSKYQIEHTLTDKGSLQIFVDLFKKEPSEVKLQNTKQIGLIEYYYNDSLLLSVSRMHDGLSFKFDKRQISSKITYSAGMYFDNICSSDIK